MYVFEHSLFTGNRRSIFKSNYVNIAPMNFQVDTTEMNIEKNCQILASVKVLILCRNSFESRSYIEIC